MYLNEPAPYGVLTAVKFDRERVEHALDVLGLVKPLELRPLIANGDMAGCTSVPGSPRYNPDRHTVYSQVTEAGCDCGDPLCSNNPSATLWHELGHCLDAENNAHRVAEWLRQENHLRLRADALRLLTPRDRWVNECYKQLPSEKFADSIAEKYALRFPLTK